MPDRRWEPLDDVDDPTVSKAGHDMMDKYHIAWLDLFDSHWWKRWDRLCRLRRVWLQKGLGE